MDFRAGLLTATLAVGTGYSLCLRFLPATGAVGGFIESIVEELGTLCLAVLLCRRRRDPLLPRCVPDAAGSTTRICRFSFGWVAAGSGRNWPLVVKMAPPRPGAGNSFKLGSCEVMLVWKSSKLMDGRKSKEPAALSESSSALDDTEPKLISDRSRPDGSFDAVSRAPFALGASIEQLDEAVCLATPVLSVYEPSPPAKVPQPPLSGGLPFGSCSIRRTRSEWSFLIPDGGLPPPARQIRPRLCDSLCGDVRRIQPPPNSTAIYYNLLRPLARSALCCEK